MPKEFKEIYIFDVAAGCESQQEEVEISFDIEITEEEKKDIVDMNYYIWLGNNIQTAWWKKN